MEDRVSTESTAATDIAPTVDADTGVDSAVLARLMEEVRNGDESSPTAYNRLHNRHNRS